MSWWRRVQHWIVARTYPDWENDVRSVNFRAWRSAHPEVWGLCDSERVRDAKEVMRRYYAEGQ